MEIIATPAITLPAMAPVFNLLPLEGEVVGRGEELSVVAGGEPPVGVVVKDPGKPTVPPGPISGLSPTVIDSMESQIFPGVTSRRVH